MADRTARSKTFASEDGSFETLVWPGRMHFRDGDGGWVEFDNDLRRAAGGWVNGRGDHAVTVPAMADGVVRVARDGQWLEMVPLGASPVRGVARGQRATFDGVFDGVSLEYAVGSSGVHETLELASAAAPNVFRYAISVSSGLSPVVGEGGTVRFVDGRGAGVFRVTSPFMYDSSTGPGSFSTDVSVQVDRAENGDGWVLTKTADRGWLDDPARVWPVTVDPVVLLEGAKDDDDEQQDCILYSEDTTTDRCDWGALRVWKDDDGPGEYRSVLQFDVAARLSDESRNGPIQVRAAELGLLKWPNYKGVDAPIALHQVTEDWDEDHVNWTRRDRDGSGNPIAWTDTGATFESAPPVGATDGVNVAPTSSSHEDTWSYDDDWEYWYPTELVQQWVDGDAEDFGMLLESDSGKWVDFYSTEEPDSSRWPRLKIDWERGIGSHDSYTFQDMDLNSRQRLRVNLGGGNLLLEQTDASIAGVAGLDLDLTRSYNSHSYQNWNLGESWTGLADHESTALWFYSDQLRVAYRDTSGSTNAFIYDDATGKYVTARDIGADLTRPEISNDRHYRLQWRDSGLSYWFHHSGRLTAIEDRSGNTISYGYDSAGEQTTITDTRGRVTTLAWDSASGEIASLTDPAGRAHSYSYDSNDLMTAYTDPANRTWTYDYDSDERLDELVDPEGNTTLIDYYPYGHTYGEAVRSITRVDDVQAGTGPTWSYVYAEDCTTIDSSYDPQPCTVVTAPQGGDTVHYVDGAGRVTRTVDAVGNGRDTTYTALGQVATATDGLANTTTFSTNADGSPTGVSLPTGASTSIAYNDTSLPYRATESTDAQGNSLQFGYDTAGRIDTITDDNNDVVDVDHNADGTVDTVTDGRNNTTTYDYTTDGELDLIDPPGPLGDTTFTYDSLSRVTSTTDGRGKTTAYGYDILDRVVQITYDNNSTVTVAYDDVGNRTSRATSGVGTTTYGWDELNRLKTEQQPGRAQIGYGYDDNGNLSTFTDTAGTVGYAYDAANQLDTITETDSDVIDIGHDNAGRRDLVSFPNGVDQTIVYDNAGRLTRIRGLDGSTVLTDLEYDYTDASNDTTLRQSVTDHVAVQTSTYGYDLRNRLTSSTGGAVDYSFGYDAASNLTSRTVGTATTTFTVNASDQVTSDSDSNSYTYDGAGNMTADGGRSYVYDDKNNTTRIVAGATTANFTYAGGDQTELLARGSRTFTPTSLGLAGQKDGTAGYVSYLRDPSGRLLARRDDVADKDFYYLFDGLGSVVAVTDETGSVVSEYTYTPYGDTETRTEAFSQPYQYVGQLGYHLDASVDAYQVGARNYTPGTGRWTQTDPSRQEANGYLYAGADPINSVDPTGLDAFGCAVGAVTTAGAITTTAIAIAGIPATGGATAPVAGAFIGILSSHLGFAATVNQCLG